MPDMQGLGCVPRPWMGDKAMLALLDPLPSCFYTP